jgi:hypothetical protein
VFSVLSIFGGTTEIQKKSLPAAWDIARCLGL